MSSASATAKAKFEAVLASAKGDSSSYPSNRVCVTQHPSSGGCEVTNSVMRRRSSTSSQTGDSRIKTMIKSLTSPPAY
ncbi:Uncharacterized protein TPAR_03055 [Tolypocladium paradoxum]|uniref:Uncharacterized protein n=1 Tax=Tolypocladium paradoxum TaxID=94208 RepID=A0A2S4L2U7_9HYPO|nr:Uncharacterized protein TPAR_03055 [Tolypocladium paradoxum]